MAERSFTDKYDDIIHLPRPVSRKHPPMAMADRAAQFSPFAALTGHGEAVKETARLTGMRVELDEYEKEILRRKLQHLVGRVEITWFVPDLRKEGGQYVTASGRVKKIDQYLREILLTDNGGEVKRIPIDEIIRIEDNPEY